MQELWERIPPDSEFVLYFACGDGSRIHALQQRYHKMKVIGVETDPVLREKAKKDGLFVVEDAEGVLMYLQNTGFRISAWVMERMAWRDETLTYTCRHQLLHFLQSDAILVWEFASNQYWKYLLSLFSGKADGTVRHCMRELVLELEKANISGIEVASSSLDANKPEYDQFIEIIKPVINLMHEPIPQWETLLSADTMVLRGWLQKQKEEPITIKTLLGETKVCARVRIDEPHSFLATLPQVTCKRVENLNELDLRNVGRNVWIWQRRLFDQASMISLQKHLLGCHALTIQEWDDDPLHWEEHFRESNFIELRSAHAIQTSTPALAEFLRQFNPEVRIFPNCIASLPSLLFNKGPEVTIFFGALNRQEDWAIIMPALNRVLKKMDMHVRVITVYDREFFDSIQCTHKKYFPFCDYSFYQKLLQQSDIALLPLLPTRFNRMKSDLKYLECAAWGTTILANPTVYADSVVHGETGFLYDSEEQFQICLEQLIEDAQLRQRLAVNAWTWVRDNRMLSLHYRDRLNWYEELFERYGELTVSLGERVPELRV